MAHSEANNTLTDTTNNLVRLPSFNRSLIPDASSTETSDSFVSQQTADEQALSIANNMLANDHYSQHLGIEIVVAKTGYSVCKMLVQPFHTNGHGSCHGGAIFSLADTTFAHICNAHNQIAVGHMCTIAYWQPAKIDDELYAYAYESGVHGRSGSYRIEITCGANGHLIAEFQGFSRSLKGASHF